MYDRVDRRARLVKEDLTGITDVLDIAEVFFHDFALIGDGKEEGLRRGHDFFDRRTIDGISASGIGRVPGLPNVGLGFSRTDKEISVSFGRVQGLQTVRRYDLTGIKSVVTVGQDPNRVAFYVREHLFSEDHIQIEHIGRAVGLGQDIAVLRVPSLPSIRLIIVIVPSGVISDVV